MEQVFNVQIKYGKEIFQYEFCPTQSMEDFRAGIYSITFVPPQNQKIVLKGKTLKDDTKLDSLGVKDNAKFMLMGAAEGMSIEEQKTNNDGPKFIEDLTPQQIAQLYKEQKGYTIPVGLRNLGNTCYMNSCLQCLRRVNELKKYFQENQVPYDPTSGSKLMASTFQRLMITMDKSTEACIPQEFFQALANIFPDFAQRQGNSFQQQDADECYMGITEQLSHATPTQDVEGNPTNIIKELFEVEFESKLQNQELPDEPVTIANDFSRKLMCQIDTGDQPVENMIDGLKLSLVQQLEKTSTVDNQMHIYNRTDRIKKLPSYLIVQMKRFQWKEAVEIAGTKATSVKLLRKVAFQNILDVYDLCTDDLKKSLDQGKEFEQKIKAKKEERDKNMFEDWKAEQEKSKKQLPPDSKQQWKMFQTYKKEFDRKEHDTNLYRPHGMGLDAGNYQLVAVLTHQGRSSNSGHYISWVHQTGETWSKFDDDVVSEQQLQDILNLSGGGDWHMGYYFFYRKLELHDLD